MRNLLFRGKRTDNGECRFCAEFGSEKGGKMWSVLPSAAPHLAADKTVYMEWCKVIGNIHDDPEGVRTNEDNL